ncbi:MAG: FtsX-like permease family protein [Gammaproteobacteria bacterium]|nr:FtsX-like permease family protein [Gammaproteobacteria bacterium]
MTLRALYRDKLYTLINIAGLSLGMTSCLILGLYLHNELTYDQNHKQHERIFRVAVEYTIDGRAERFAVTSSFLGPMLAADFAEVQAFVRFRPLSLDGRNSERLIRHGEKAFFWRDVYYADENVFDVFTHTILYGDKKAALTAPLSVAVSQTFAEKYFGDADPVGETVVLENGEQKTITLVFADLPENTHLKYDVLVSYNSLDERLEDARWLWGGADFTYVLMPKGYAVTSFDTVSDVFFTRYMADHGNYLNGTWTSWLQPLADIHLRSDVAKDRPTGNRFYLYGFMTVGAFILLIACINYMNLATARAAKRAREIGMRKILGATRLPLGAQFLSESILLSLIALAVTIVLFEAAVALTPISELLDQSLSLRLSDNPGMLAWLIGSSVLIGLVAGVYPALYLSSIAPLSALLGGRVGYTRNHQFREVLVLIQFTISIAVIASTIIMLSQMKFIADRSLGFDKENRLVVTLRGVDLIEQFAIIKNELEKSGRVIGVTATDRLMGLTGPLTFFETETNEGATVSVTTQLMPIAGNFLEVMGMELVSGRSFSSELLPDDTIMVNEAAVRFMDWEQPIGKHMGRRNRTVIGVVKDFNFDSLHKVVEPIALFQYQTDFSNMPVEDRPLRERFLIINVATDDLNQTLRFIKDTLARFDPKSPFKYQFVDEVLDDLYRSERRLTQLIGIFSAVSIFIACIGLFGMAAFTTAQRTKEIGIRKVLGASTTQIIMLLCRKVLMLVAIGSLIASLTAYVAMDAWLETFAHRVSINPSIFLLSATAVLAISFTTVALQSLTIAKENPIHALRFE